MCRRPATVLLGVVVQVLPLVRPSLDSQIPSPARGSFTDHRPTSAGSGNAAAGCDKTSKLQKHV
eukprot:scaffold215896_cov30-Tisochrysis_lutea.AAC.2